MATQSVHKDRQGPIWPLGMIQVVTPGTPVNLMSLIDAALVNAPESATSATSDEYTPRCYEILFFACKPGAAHGVQVNTGNIYIMRKGVQGAGNRDDYGSMVAALPSGATTATNFPFFRLTAAALNRNVFSPYEFYLDADNGGDGCLVTLNIE
jgi:hypothetical protein